MSHNKKFHCKFNNKTSVLWDRQTESFYLLTKMFFVGITSFSCGIGMVLETVHVCF